jgi:hypothetical protein
MANTLTVNRGQSGGHLADQSLESRPEPDELLFTLQNPHDVPARKFALKIERKKEAIRCDFERVPGTRFFTYEGN